MVSRWPKVEDNVDMVDVVPLCLILWTRKTKKTTAELLDTLAGRGDSSGRGIKRRTATAVSGGIQRERASEGQGVSGY